MPADGTYDYAIIRVVPRVERGERMNVGVIVSAVDADYLEARIDADLSRLLVLDPESLFIEFNSEPGVASPRRR